MIHFLLTSASYGMPAASFKNYGGVMSARMMRVIPAFGVGGTGNRMLRKKLVSMAAN